MTDASAPKKGWFARLTEGLSRSSKTMTDQVVGVFAKKPVDQATLDELEEMLIEADLGTRSAAKIRKSRLSNVSMTPVPLSIWKVVLPIAVETSTEALPRW